MSSTNASQQWPKLPLKLRLQLSLLAALNSTNIGSKLVNILSETTVDASPNNPIDKVLSSDITFDPDRNLWLRLFTPTQASADTPVIVYFHGGGFQNYAADNKYFDALCKTLAKEIPAVVVSVNYRKTPFFKYPCQYEDGFDALRFLDKAEFESEFLKGSGDLRKCFIAGDSAGANLAHHVVVKSSGHEFKNLRIRGLIELMPFFGGEERTESELRLTNALMLTAERTDRMWKSFLPEGANRDHGAANVMGPNGVDLKGVEFPRTLVICGGFDPLQDWAQKYVEWLEKCGKVELKVYENAFHAFYVFPELPETAMMVRDVRHLVQHQLSKVTK